jgi:hypothetical protein
VYQTAGVTDAQAATDLTAFTNGYNDITTARKTALQGKIKEYRIVPVSVNNSCTSDGNGKYVLEIKTGYGATQVENIIIGWIGIPIVQIKSPVRDMVRIARLPARQNGRG